MFQDTRFRFLLTLLLLYLGVNLLVRISFIILFSPDISTDYGIIAKIFLYGTVNDFFVFACLSLPLAPMVLLFSWRNKIARAGAFAAFAAYTALFLFTAVSEYFFWDEFSVRFNFIAVDYLVYTQEVINNIMESYPVTPLLCAITGLALLITTALLRPLQRARGTMTSGRCRFAACCLWGIIACISIFAFTPPSISRNTFDNELSHNGVRSLFYAFFNNQLNYRLFYPVLNETEALRIVRDDLREPGASFVSSTPADLRRDIDGTEPSRRCNVIQIVVESLGSESLGDRTPNINALQEKSLRFTNMRATGTRTVRGIEALTLSIPPTPGNSIVRRPGCEGLFTTGTIFRQYGYDTAFIYGGYGYFDNMNTFFAGNGFRIVDRASIPEEDKTFSNAWGICDEDLLNASLREADAAYATGKPFYQFVLTTSNHRPFTYPDGKVDIPSGTSRSGAIKYTDYAIGNFMRKAERRPWFRDTIFVIVADHTAGSAGKTVIPPERYTIPCIIYSPAHIIPRTVDTLCSQIDLPPTLFSLLGWSYRSKFFGRNILNMPPEEGRAFIGTYQLLGRYDADDRLVVLAPRQLPALESATGRSDPASESPSTRERIIRKAQASYQVAQDMFTSGSLKEDHHTEVPFKK